MMRSLRLTTVVASILTLVGCALSAGESNQGQLGQQSQREPHATDRGSLGIGGRVEGLTLDCSSEEQPSGGSCLPTDPENGCQACVAERCCAEQRACNSTEPMNACAFGSTLLSGRPIEGGEIACLMECLAMREEDGLLVGDDRDLQACSGECSASECGMGEASGVSQELASCILGGAHGGGSGCRDECGLNSQALQ